MHHLDGKHVVFGRILDGQEVVRVAPRPHGFRDVLWSFVASAFPRKRRKRFHMGVVVKTRVTP